MAKKTKSLSEVEQEIREIKRNAQKRVESKRNEIKEMVNKNAAMIGRALIDALPDIPLSRQESGMYVKAVAAVIAAHADEFEAACEAEGLVRRKPTDDAPGQDGTEDGMDSGGQADAGMAVREDGSIAGPGVEPVRSVVGGASQPEAVSGAGPGQATGTAGHSHAIAFDDDMFSESDLQGGAQ